MDLRNTIRQLQVDNRTLAGSLQQLSTGADLLQVIESLPEQLRPAPTTAPARGSMPFAATGRAGGASLAGGGLPWSAAGDLTLPPTPKSANVLRLLQPTTQPRSRAAPKQQQQQQRASQQRRSSSVPEGSRGAAVADVGAGLKGSLGRNGLRKGSFDFNLSTSVSASQSSMLPKRFAGGASPVRRRFANVTAAAAGGSSSPTGKAWASSLGPHAGGLEVDPLLFPELAALEAQFMESLTGGGDPSSLPSSTSTPPQQQQQQQRKKKGGAAPAVAVGGECEPSSRCPTSSEEQAVQWARENRWFGLDLEMTEFAYQVHDTLVDVEHIDASSATYYSELERRVAARFPDRWAQQQREQRAPAAKMTPMASTAAASAFGRALRSSAKETASPRRLPHGGPAAPMQQPVVVHGFMNPGLRQQDAPAVAVGTSGARPPAAAAAAAPRGGHAAASAVPPSSGGTTASRSQGSPSSAEGASLHQPVSIDPATTSKAALRSSLAKPIRAAPELPSYSSFSPVSYEQMQAEYLRQRALVVEELKRAKDQAEAEKARIMSKIGKALSSSRWKS